jgi:hypothetical protein
MEIEVFGATGEFATGKTILGLSIAPGVHPEGHPFAGKPRTLYLDLEKSGATYGGTGCLRIDVPAELAKLHGPNYTARQVAEWFNALPSRLKPGQFDVTLVDPLNDIESGEVDLVKSNPAAHGYTANQFNASVGLLMAAMKAHWKKLLMSFSNVCKCLFFTTHLRDEFKGGKPSGNREPRGKETLAELASLYLWLERLPDEKGNTSEKPSAIVLKHRLSDTRIGPTGELEIVELMPRRIPVATVQEIRRYIANPPNIEKPATGERVIEKPVTEIDLQRMRLATAEAQTAAAQAQTALVDRQRELTAIRQAAQTTTPRIPDRGAPQEATAQENEIAAKLVAQEAEKRLAEQEAEGRRLMEQNQQPQITPSVPIEPGTIAEKMAATTVGGANRIDQFKLLGTTSGVAPDKLKLAFTLRNTQRFTQLSETDQDEILAWLGDVAACQLLVKALCLNEAKVAELCRKASVERIPDLDGPMAIALRATLQKALDARQPKN